MKYVELTMTDNRTYYQVQFNQPMNLTDKEVAELADMLHVSTWQDYILKGNVLTYELWY